MANDDTNTSSGLMWIAGIVVLLLIAWGAWSYFSQNDTNITDTTITGDEATTSTNEADRQAVSDLVIQFGSRLQRVSLLAPSASSTIMSEYGPYIESTLLSQWSAHPTSAPGKQTSSPWPDHITIDSVNQNPGGYEVRGKIALKTSAGDAGTVPFVALVQKGADDSWKIVQFTQTPSLP